MATSEQQLPTYPLEELFASSSRILKGSKFIVILSSEMYRTNGGITMNGTFKNAQNY
jgi:hypothetical protein